MNRFVFFLAYEEISCLCFEFILRVKLTVWLIMLDSRPPDWLAIPGFKFVIAYRSDNLK